MHNLDFLGGQVRKQRRGDLHRKMVFGKVGGAYITIRGKQYVNLCSNDYLAIRPGRSSKSQMQSSSRLLAGSDESHHTLEKKLARLKSQQAALVYPTGYMANLGLLSAIIQKGDLVLSDSLNHASIIDACRLAGARVSVYGHNDMDDLKSGLSGSTRRFIITEGVFSMDGDLARLPEIAELAQKKRASVIVDDAHGDFVLGRGGRGTASYLGAEKKIDAFTGSLSKALGSFGGYVATGSDAAEFLVNNSRAFIYTSALPSSLAEHALCRMNQNLGARRRRLAGTVRKISSGLRSMGYDVPPSSHIMPVMVGAEKDAIRLSRKLLAGGVFAQPIRYPTVPKGMARIRISVTAWLESNHTEDILGAFERAGRRSGVI